MESTPHLHVHRDRAHRPAPWGESLLCASAGRRLAFAAAGIALLWLTVGWALG